MRPKNWTHRCVKAVCDLNIDEMKTQEACGKLPILTLMYLAREKGWKAQLLDYRNSGDTSGDKSHGVVGYSAIAFYEPAPENYDGARRESFCWTLPGRRWRMLRPMAARPGSQCQGRVTKIVGDERVLRDVDRKWHVARLHRAHSAAGSALPGGCGQRAERRHPRPAFPAGAAR